jgi:hypothetical protein
MNRRFGWAMLLAAGMVFGYALNGIEKTIVPSAAAQDTADDDRGAEAIAQLKELNAQIKQLQAFLRSGQLRVIDIINPDAPSR